MSSTIAHLEMASQQHSSPIEHEYVRRNLSTVTDHGDKGVYLEPIDGHANNLGEDRYNTIPYYLELAADYSATKNALQLPLPAARIRPLTIVVGILVGIILLAFLAAILALAAEAFVILKGENSQLTASNQPVPLSLSTPTRIALHHVDLVNSTCFINLRSYGGDDNDTQHCSIEVNGVTYLQATPPSVTDVSHTRGINTLVLNPLTCTGSDLNNFDTWLPGSFANLSNYISNLQFGTVLVGVTCDDAMFQLSGALVTLASVGISVADVSYRGKFEFVMMKGFPQKTILGKAMDGGAGQLVSVQLQGSEMTKI